MTVGGHQDTAGNEVARIAVAGGTLTVEVARSATNPVLAIHGISSQRKLWNWLRATAPELSLIAPDLRGRGDSVGVTGGSSMGTHAADMVAVLDALGLESVDVCGMSMGGFVAVELAACYPERVQSLILVDGGLPMPTPARPHARGPAEGFPGPAGSPRPGVPFRGRLCQVLRSEAVAGPG